MAIEYFCCYHSYARKLAKLSDQEVGRLFRALLKYSETGEAQELTGRESVAFDFIADDIDRAKEAYQAKCDQNKKNRSSTTVHDRPRPSTTADKDKTKDKTKDKKETSPDGDVKKDPAVAAVMTAYMDRINPNVSEQLVAEMLGFLQVMGQECCLRAIQIAQDERKTQWSYVRGILRAKQAQGVRCLADWDKIDDERERRKQNGGHSCDGGPQNPETHLPGIYL